MILEIARVQCTDSSLPNTHSRTILQLDSVCNFFSLEYMDFKCLFVVQIIPGRV